MKADEAWPEAWIDAFEAQFVQPGFEEKLRRYARVRARMVARSGRRVDEYYVRELVQDAIDDTLSGVIAWDPARVSLEKHFLDAIRSRSRHDFVQAARFRHQSFDVANTALVREVEGALGSGDARSGELAEVAQHTLDTIRAIAPSDHDVLRLLEAYQQESTKKVDVMRVSGLSSKRYEAARKRLNRLVLQLPSEVREAALARA